MSQRIHKVMYGTTERQDFSKIKDVLEIPYLIEVQKNSYANFIGDGIKEVFRDYSPIVDFAGKLKLEFLSHTLEVNPSTPSKSARTATPLTRFPSRSRLALPTTTRARW